MAKILFVTWDGPQLQYLQGLFLPIFAGLANRGHNFSVVQFSWGEASAPSPADACAEIGVAYHRIEVDRRMPGVSSFATAWNGGGAIDRAVADWDIDLLFPRALFAGLATLRSEAARTLPLLFDADGLPADERVEFGGLSRHGPTYRALRLLEARILGKTNHVLVRTREGADVLAGRSPRPLHRAHFTVVSNPRPTPPILSTEGWPAIDPAAPRLVYVGSLGPQYLPHAIFGLVYGIKRRLPGLTLDLFTGDREIALKAVAKAGLANAEWIRVDSLPPEMLAARLPTYDAGLALRASSLSMRAVAPIKLGDYLMAGLPIIGSAAAGDGAALRDEGVLLAVEGEVDADRTATWLVETVAKHRDALRLTCRALGELRYSLDRAVTLYDQAIARALAQTR